ncbi:MAG: PIN domain-containing protein [Holophagaceae bacterium]|nr:PIN domain-containing protein [Holophagaceae bacterium]
MKPAPKPRYLLDINVLLDYMQQRHPWYPQAKALFQAEHQEKVDLYIAANTIPTLFYLIRHKDSARKAITKLEILLQRVRVADVTARVIERAFRLGFDDLEDGIQAAAAQEAGIPVLVTRDSRHFGKIATLQILTPEIAVAALGYLRT